MNSLARLRILKKVEISRRFICRKFYHLGSKIQSKSKEKPFGNILVHRKKGLSKRFWLSNEFSKRTIQKNVAHPKMLFEIFLVYETLILLSHFSLSRKYIFVEIFLVFDFDKKYIYLIGLNDHLFNQLFVMKLLQWRKKEFLSPFGEIRNHVKRRCTASIMLF